MQNVGQIIYLSTYVNVNCMDEHYAKQFTQYTSSTVTSCKCIFILFFPNIQRLLYNYQNTCLNKPWGVDLGNCFQVFVFTVVLYLNYP